MGDRESIPRTFAPSIGVADTLPSLRRHHGFLEFTIDYFVCLDGHDFIHDFFDGEPCIESDDNSTYRYCTGSRIDLFDFPAHGCDHFTGSLEFPAGEWVLELSHCKDGPHRLCGAQDSIH